MSDVQRHPGGRPTKYTDDMPARLREYIKNFRQQGDAIPSQPGFAVLVGISERTIHRWGKEHDEFCLALEELHSAQHCELLNKGLNSDFNSTICKLVLSSNHDYAERSDLTTKGDKITPQIVSYEDAVKEDDPE